MTEQRNAAEIRAYCEAVPEPPWCYLLSDKGGGWYLGLAINEAGTMGAGDVSYEDPDDMIMTDGLACNELAHDNTMPEFIANARADLPRVLAAAVRLRGALAYCIQFAKPACRPPQIAELLDETAWLADSPEPALSPDGENGEEGEG